jgi:hypothetical protein
MGIYPDTFILRDGKKIFGTQIERTKKAIIYKDNKGVTKTIPITKIKSVSIDKKKDIVVENYKIVEKKESSPSLFELIEKIQTLTNKVDELSEKNKEQSSKITELSEKVKANPTSPKENTTENLTEIKKEDDSNVSLDITHEVVSDFIWRGNSYGGEFLSRRNNMPYTGTTQYWAYQPNIRLNAPIKGLYLEFWGNFPLVGREDRDSDMRLFQTSPGAAAIDPNVMFSKLDSIQADPTNNNIMNSGLLYDPDNNIANNKCLPDGIRGGCTNPNVSFVDPRSIKKHKERNGMARTDGGFTTFAYNFQNKKFGDITWGIWFYYQLDKNAKYSWDEYFIFWGLPFLQEYIKPTFSLYTQSSFENSSLFAGGHYLSFAVSHTFFEGNFFKLQPTSNLGYKYQNDNVSQKSGFYDLTTGLKFMFADFFFSLNHAYRPNVYMYDNDTWYYSLSQGSQAQPNRSQYDGKTVDPSKLFGPKNEAVYSAIDKLDVSDSIKSYIKAEYQSQKIVQHLFYISFGYNSKF